MNPVLLVNLEAGDNLLDKDPGSTRKLCQKCRKMTKFRHCKIVELHLISHRNNFLH